MKKLEISSGRESWSFDVQQQERGVMLNELRESGRLGGLLQRPEVTGRRRRRRKRGGGGGDLLATKTVFFKIDHFQKCFSEEKKKKKRFTKTQKRTDSVAVPKSGPVWCCEFYSPDLQKQPFANGDNKNCKAHW